MDRYARQSVALPPGESERLHQAEVRVGGKDLAAEVAALYLAGAGVRKLIVDPALAAKAQAQNAEVWVEAMESAEERSFVEVAGTRKTDESAAPVLQGSRLARWALARILS